MRWGRHIHAHVLRSEKGCRSRVTHVHTRSDCVHTWDDTVRLNYTSRFVRVIYSSHIVSIKLDTVTPLRCCAVHERYDGPTSIGLSALVPGVPGGATRTRFDAVTCVLPSGAARMFFETMLSTLAWISYQRCNPRLTVPPARASHFHAASAVLSASALTVSHTRRDDASPASVSRPWWWARSGTAAIVQSGRAHVSIAIRRLMED